MSAPLRRRPLPLLLATAVYQVAAGVAVAHAQSPPEDFVAEVELVRLNVGVVHSAGSRVPPLVAEDFQVYDNGVLQDVRLVLRPADTPVRVALVLDSSPSVRPWWPTLQRAAITFLASLDEEGCAYVLPFSAGIGPGRWGRYTSSDWRSFFQRVPAGDGTSLFDALLVALNQLDIADLLATDANLGPADRDEEPSEAQLAEIEAVVSRSGAYLRPEALDVLAAVIRDIIRNNPITHLGNCDLRRHAGEQEVAYAPGEVLEDSIKAILLLSDGADTTSFASFEDVLIAARLARVPVFPVLLGSAARDRDLRASLEEIARTSGGLVMPDVAPNSLLDAYRRVLTYLESTYVLAYDPDAAPATGMARGSRRDTELVWHDVRVVLRRPLLRPIVRTGYYR